ERGQTSQESGSLTLRGPDPDRSPEAPRTSPSRGLWLQPVQAAHDLGGEVGDGLAVRLAAHRGSRGGAGFGPARAPGAPPRRHDRLARRADVEAADLDGHPVVE